MALVGKARKLSAREERDLLRFDFDSTASLSLPRGFSKRTEEGGEQHLCLFKAEVLLRGFCPCAAKASGNEEGEIKRLTENVLPFLDPLLTSESIDTATLHQAKLLHSLLQYRRKYREESLGSLSQIFLDTPPDLSPPHQRLLAEGYSLSGLMHPKQHRRLYYNTKALQCVARAIAGYQDLRDARARSSSHGNKQVRSLDTLFLPEVGGVPELLAQSVLSSQEDLYPSLSDLRQVLIVSSRFQARGVRLRSAVSLARILLLQYPSRTENSSWAESYEANRHSVSLERGHTGPRVEPSTPHEEAVLLLKIALDGIELDTGYSLETNSQSEPMGHSDTPKLRPDSVDIPMRDSCREASEHSLALRVYNLLCLTLTDQSDSLLAPLQHSLRRQFFSQELIWLQYVEVLVSVEKWTLATRALDTLLSHRPGLLPARVLAAKLALDHVSDPSASLRHAGHLVSCGVPLLEARGHALSGLSEARLALRATDTSDRARRLRAARCHLDTAAQRDTRCYEYKLALGCVLAWEGDLTRATSEAQLATSLDPTDPRSSLLLVLILSSQGQRDRALSLCDRLSKKHPLSPEVLLLCARLLLRERGYEEALLACRQCITVWQGRHGGAVPSELFSPFNASMTSGSSGGSVVSESGTGSREGAGRLDAEAAGSLRAIWLLTGRVFLSAGRYSDARSCFREANALRAGRSAQVLWCFGEVERTAGQKGKAKAIFESALSVDPSHPDSLESLGCLLVEDGQVSEGEHFLRLSMGQEERPIALRELGVVHQKRGEYNKSVELLGRSLMLQTCRPIVPFYSLLEKPIL